MNTASFNSFECHMYVTGRGVMNFSLPIENGPQQVIRFEPLAHDKLIEPDFRQLLAAFESVGTLLSPLQTVQV